LKVGVCSGWVEKGWEAGGIYKTKLRTGRRGREKRRGEITGKRRGG
jgi:hypothetical protein